MGQFMNRMKGAIAALLEKAQKVFDIKPMPAAELDAFLSNCISIYKGFPPWLDDDAHIKTVNFAESVASEMARLVTMGISVSVTGSKRAEWLQGQLDLCKSQLRHWVEFCGAAGTIAIKPNGDDGVDMFMPDEFVITHITGDIADAAVFQYNETSNDGTRDYTRLEYHRFDGDKYVITNRTFSGSHNSTQKECAIETTPWIGIEPEVAIEGVERPLFSIFRMPAANNRCPDSPLGLPVFASAITELEDLDIAYSRNAKEVYDSQKIVLLDSDRLMQTGCKPGITTAMQMAREIKLPDYIRAVSGDGQNEVYHEIIPKLQTDERITGINNLLSQIGYKCGFSNGYFVFDEKSGVVTATQVESDDRRTIQLVSDVREKLRVCIEGLLYALDKFADLYDLAPVGTFEVNFSFGDVVYSYEQDKATWWGYVLQGKVPAWMYFVKFEGMTEEDAKAMVSEAEPTTPAVVDEE